MKKKSFDFDDLSTQYKIFGQKILNHEPFNLILFGNCEFFIHKLMNNLRHRARDQGLEVKSIDLSENSGKILEEIWEQQGLFAAKTVFFLSNLDKSKEGVKVLTKLLSKKTSNFFVFQYQKESLPKEFDKKIDSLWCNVPLYQNLGKAITWLSQDLQIKVDSSAVEMLIHLYGSDLHAIENALKIATLIQPDKIQVTAKMLTESGAFLREDDSLKLSQSLISGKQAESLRLLFDLLERRESALGILALLSRLARTSLQFLGGTPETRLPPMIAKQYGIYAKKQGAEKLSLALTKCAAAELSLKSSTKASEYHILAELIGFF